jgi:hypothetical protein
MGWGVEQEQSFPQLLERKTGRRVLNTGVSSYGTAREVAMLGRVDLSRVTHLILQYCDNDEWENDHFVTTGVVNDRIERVWTAEVEAQAARNRYWFGKYTLWWIDRLMEKSAQADEAAARRKKQIADMITVLARLAPSGIGRARLVVFGAETHAGWLGGFAELLRAHLAAHPELPAWIREMRIVELPPDIDSYVLDDHWTARGHAQVADALLPALR